MIDIKTLKTKRNKHCYYNKCGVREKSILYAEQVLSDSCYLLTQTAHTKLLSKHWFSKEKHIHLPIYPHLSCSITASCRILVLSLTVRCKQTFVILPYLPPSSFLNWFIWIWQSLHTNNKKANHPLISYKDYIIQTTGLYSKSYKQALYSLSAT